MVPLFICFADSNELVISHSHCIFSLYEGGGCGVGFGLGWGFGSAYGSQYRSSRVIFQGLEFGKEDRSQDGAFKEKPKSTKGIQASG